MIFQHPLVFAGIGYCTVATTAIVIAGCLIGWALKAFRKCWVAVRTFDFRSRAWAPPFGIPRPAPLPKHIPAPPAMTPRPDLDAALAAQVRHLNAIVASAPRNPTRAEIRSVVDGATNACANAANQTEH